MIFLKVKMPRQKLENTVRLTFLDAMTKYQAEKRGKIYFQGDF